MRLRLILSLLSLLAVSCSSDTATQPSTTKPPFDGKFELKFLDHPEDTVIVMPKGPYFLTIGVSSDGKLISGWSGMVIYYFDPIAKQFTTTQGQIPTWTRTTYTGDTIFAIDYQVDVLGTKAGPFRKYFDVRLRVAQPTTSISAIPVTDSSYMVSWHREPSDDDIDTLVIRSSDGIEKYLVRAPDTSYLYSKARSGRHDTLELHTAGGIAPSSFVASPFYTSQVFRLRNYLTAGYAVGIRMRTSAIEATDNSQLDSANMIFDAGNAGKLRLVSPLSFLSRGRYMYFTGLKPGTIDTASLAPISGQLELSVDVASGTPMFSSITWYTGSIPHQGLLEIAPQANGRLVGTDAEGDFIDVRFRAQL